MIFYLNRNRPIIFFSGITDTFHAVAMVPPVFFRCNRETIFEIQAAKVIILDCRVA